MARQFADLRSVSVSALVLASDESPKNVWQTARATDLIAAGERSGVEQAGAETSLSNGRCASYGGPTGTAEGSMNDDHAQREKGHRS